MIPRAIRAVLVGAFAIVALLAGAQSAHAGKPSSEALRWATQRILAHGSGYGSRGVSRVEVRERLMNVFEHADVDGNGISQSDYDFKVRRDLSERRAQHVLAILRNDLDGDGRVTRAEVAQFHARDARRPLFSGGFKIDPSPEQIARVLDGLVVRDMTADSNRDGAITWDEMLAQAEERAGPGRSVHPSLEPVPLMLDGDGDGSVSERELTTVIDETFDAVDADRDGFLSRDERRALQAMASELGRQGFGAERGRRVELFAATRARHCGLPELSRDGQLVFVNAHEGAALSTVSLGGDDQVVTVSHVVVERGEAPLALVLTSIRPNIWLLTGDVARVSNVIVGASTGDATRVPRAGVVGVPATKIAVARSTACLRHTRDAARKQLQREATRLAAELGRRPDLIFAEHSIATIRVPSGATDSKSPLPQTKDLSRDGPAGDIWTYVLKHHPRGLIEIDATQVSAQVNVQRFEVLPREAGLAQLVESGALEIMFDTIRAKRMSDGSSPGAAPLRDAAPHSVPRRYMVKRQITIPTGLDGVHAVTFVVPDGVAMPRGDPGQSQIVRKPQKLTFNRK